MLLVRVVGTAQTSRRDGSIGAVAQADCLNALAYQTHSASEKIATLIYSVLTCALPDRLQCGETLCPTARMTI